MLPKVIEAFNWAAEEHRCWIGLREPNVLADFWFDDGKALGRGVRCYPKPLGCKAKTADNPAFHGVLAGLVVDPTPETGRPAAFTPGGYLKALSAWPAFAPQGKLPGGYTRVEDGELKGAIKWNDWCLFSDYDLMAIHPADESGRMVLPNRPTDGVCYKDGDGKALMDRIEEARFPEVQISLNFALGKPMIQHGPEFGWGGVGPSDNEMVWWFGPRKGLWHRWPSWSPPSTDDWV